MAQIIAIAGGSGGRHGARLVKAVLGGRDVGGPCNSDVTLLGWLRDVSWDESHVQWRLDAQLERWEVKQGR